LLGIAADANGRTNMDKRAAEDGDETTQSAFALRPTAYARMGRLMFLR
jgi:hypothetical protein